MQAKAIQRHVRITPRKCNQVLELIRGLAVEQAQTTLQFTPKQGSRVVQKVLKSAVANALHEGKVRLEDLVVKEAVVGEGPTIKRMMPRARGSGSRILKRTSHIRIVLTDEKSEPAKSEKTEEETATAAQKKTKKAKKTAKASKK